MKKLLSLIIAMLIISIAYSQGGPSRSAKTGKYVSKSYANKHPSTTYTQKKR